MPCRGFIDERTQKNEDARCQNYLSLMANVGVIPYEEKGDIGNKKPEDLSKCKMVHRGDFVINSMNYGIGSYGASAYDGVCSPVYIVMKPRQNVVESGFAFRVFEDKSFQAYAQSLGNGILAHRCAISWDDLKGISVGIPPVDEQRAILEFLDRETAKIDALIAEQQRLIELLQEKRQAVISHAVTKGLNPNAPMKDSGVEWLGEVPEHWDIKRIKHLSKAISKGTTPSTIGAEFTPSGIRFIKAENITSTGVEPLPEFFISDETNQELSRSILFGGEVLVVIAGATTGKSAVIPKEICPANTNQAVCFIRTKCAIASSFINHWLSQKSVQNHIAIGSVQSAQPNLSMEDLGNIPIALPPLEEMRQITSLCDLRRADAEVSAAESSKLVELLKERRSALISAAVTGQIDVRGLAEAEEEA
jgi:type I restriction enzyme S subunit